MAAQRLPGMKNLYASPVAANGKDLLPQPGSAGLVIKEQPKLEVLGTNQLDEGFDASPAVVGRQMFLRGKINSTASPTSEPPL